MGYIEKEVIDEVNSRLDIRDYIDGCDPNKNSQTLNCPSCGEKKFKVDRRKNIGHCFACRYTLNPIQAYMSARRMPDSEFPGAVRKLAEEVNVQIEERPKIPSGKSASGKGSAKKKQEFVSVDKNPFFREQLDSSGLTVEDVTAEVVIKDQLVKVCPFTAGSVDTQTWSVDEFGSDMLIHYYDLEGRPMMYKPKGGRSLKPYVRVRWMIPDLHPNENGKGVKYQTMPGASCKVYIPERIRSMYRNSAVIETLFLQEGEKKAEKACKHGIPSIAIQGIFNTGNKAEGLIAEIQSIVRRCKVKNIALLMDSDWNHLSSNLIIGDRVDERPNLFSKAVIKFRDYIRTLHNAKLSVDVWWGHVNELPTEEKGVDDLLVGTLKGSEQSLADEISAVMNSHNGIGRYVNVHKISSLSDMQIRDFWNLNDFQAFYEQHKEMLEPLGSFKLGSIRYKVEEGKLKQISGFAGGEDIYSVIEKKQGEKSVELNMVETLKFLNANGFYLIRVSDDTSSAYDFCRVDDGIIDLTIPMDIRKFVYEYINKNCRESYVLETFAKKINNWLSDKRLENLEVHADPYIAPIRGESRTYYANGAVIVTSDSITPGAPITAAWRKQIVKRDFERIPIIKDILKVGDTYQIQYAEAAKCCEFLQYIVNTSNNCYEYGQERDITQEELNDWVQHIVNKITAIGFMLCEYKYSSDHGVVVAQDHQMSEVGQNQGGTGKSMLGVAIGKIVSQAFIIGSEASTSDKFLFSTVNKWTRSVFIDDVRTNFNFKDFFSYVTGPMLINPKGSERYEIPVDRSPKIIITTNHTINGANEAAVARRINYVEASTWYNPGHTPYHDFGHQLFDDWDEHQWQLFDNFMMECVMYYIRSIENDWVGGGHGVVRPPMHNIQLRSLRQAMSELFFKWAEEYFDPTGSNLNERRSRRDMYNSFIEFAVGCPGHGVTNSNFRKRLIYYCKFRGYDFNINKPNEKGQSYSDWKPLHPNEVFEGRDDKSNGTEYYQVFSPEKLKQDKPF